MPHTTLLDDPMKALQEASVSTEAGRTQYFEIRNDSTQFNLTLVLAQGVQESGPIPPGYQKDTGVVVTGTNVVPGTTQKGIIQPSINVQVTHGKCSLHWKRVVAPYNEGDLNLQDQFAPAGQYFLYCTWRVIDKAERDEQPSIVADMMTAPQR